MIDYMIGLSIFNTLPGLNVIVLDQGSLLLYRIIAQGALGQLGQECQALEGANRATMRAAKVIAMVHQYGDLTGRRGQGKTKTLYHA